MSGDLSGFSGDVLIRLEQRNTNEEQMTTGSVEEKEWMQRSSLFYASHEDQGLFAAQLPWYKQHAEKAQEGEREVVLSQCTHSVHVVRSQSVM